MLTVGIGCFVAYLLFTIDKYNLNVLIDCLPCRAFWLSVLVCLEVEGISLITNDCLLSNLTIFSPFISGAVAIVVKKFFQ